MRKIGTVYSSNPKGWIFIYITPQERYFGHMTQLTGFAVLPEVGAQVSFDVVPPRKEGQLPCAMDIKPVETAASPASAEKVSGGGAL
jgi:hypothetical protein